MANQELDRTLTSLAGKPSRSKRITLVFLALSLLALLILAALLLRGERQPVATTPNEVMAEQAPAARQGETVAVAAASSPAAAVEQPAYYTERYWDMAAALAASSPAGQPKEDYAYYTERYWILGQQGD